MRDKLNCIMVIDDDEPTNFISTMLIEEADCTQHLEVIETGNKALTYINTSLGEFNTEPRCIKPNLVFLDINMPRMNGWEFLEEYKKIRDDRLSDTVIIMLTTSLNPDDKLRAEKIDRVGGFENKPLTKEMVLRIIETHFTPVGKQAVHLQQKDGKAQRVLRNNYD